MSSIENDPKATAGSEQRPQEEWLRLLLELPTDFVWEVDQAGVFTYISSGVRAALGYSSDEVRGRPIFAFMSAEEAGRVSAILLPAFSRHESLVMLDLTMVRSDGSSVLLETRGIPMLDGNGTAGGYRGVCRDVTKRRRAQELSDNALRLNEAILDNIPDIAWLKDAESRFISINEAFGKACGVSPKDIVGKTDLDVWPAELAHRYRADDREVIQTGRRKRVVEPLTDRAGVRTWIETIKTPIFNERNEVIGTTGIARDVTERRRAEEELASHRDRLNELVRERTADLERLRRHNELILSSAGEGILGLDQEGNHTFVNPAAARMLGYEIGELIGTHSHTTWHHTKADGSPHPEEECPIYGARRTGKTAHVSEDVFWRKDGSSFPVEYVSTPVIEGGERIGVVVTFTDITERKGLQQQFLQAQKMEAVGRLAGGVAHDFNNLLTVILSYSSMLAEDLPPASQAKSDLDEIRKAGERAAGLTRQLLAFSRRQVLRPEAVNLNDSVSSMEKMVRRLIGEDVDLESALAAGLGTVLVDPGQIEQVIMNLVVNARDAMPRGGKLTIETANCELDEAYAEKHVAVTPGRYVRLTVTDNGVGMDQATLARIFEPFFTTKEQGKGTGLGLSTVFGIVKQSSGSIWVYSEPGKGTSFKIYLPRTDAATAPRERVERGGVMSRGSETILLVEDDDQVRQLARRTLEKHGYTVLDADGPGAALVLSEQHAGAIDLLLTDVVMPHLSGRELAEELVKDRPTMKVIYMSGYTDDTVIRHGLLDPAIVFLQKPLVPRTLAQTVREVLDRTK